MRAVLMLALVVACGCKRPTAAEPAFSADNYERTRDWLRVRVLNLERIRAGKNEITDREVLNKTRDELALHVGKRVSWRVPVGRVENGIVHFDEELLSSPRELRMWLAIVARNTPPGSAPDYVSCIPIGAAISQEQAGRLRKGGTLMVKGRIDRTKVDGDAADLFCAFYLVDLSTEP